jgi:hypothetical protein
LFLARSWRRLLQWLQAPGIYALETQGDAAVEDRPHWRRHKGACPFYRENWIVSDPGPVDPSGETVLYEVYCLKDTPPVTIEEQDRCLTSPHVCWRLRQKKGA